VAKLESAAYQPGKRAMLKIKHARSADCVVAGLRLYKDRADAVGSLLLGLHDDAGVLHHVGVTSSFSMATRQALLRELAPLRENAAEAHPWRDWHDAQVGDAQRLPGAKSRWSGDKNLAWIPLRPERVCEVRYDHLQGRRFRHATTFLRWRPDKPAADCRYDQLEVTTPYELARVFGA
ncbi:MAG TPA: ATP-dependent DNA ligase, partial [Burkholderiaceae bacterium]